MLDDPLGQWLFTLVFGALALHSLGRVVAERRRALLAVGHLLHAVMALVMVAMAHPWWERLPVAAQIVVFAGSAAWFAAMAVLLALDRLTPERLGGHGVGHQLVHVLMMLAMVWMVAAMAPGADGPGHGVLPASSALVGTGMTAALVVATVVLVVEVAEHLHRPGSGSVRLRARGADVAAGATMCGGMASMCWLMLLH